MAPGCGACGVRVSPLTVTLDEITIERIAQRANILVLANLIELGLENLVEQIAERLGVGGEPSGQKMASRLVTAQELADTLGVSPETVYAHAEELGARRLGDGPRPRLRFDLDQA